MGSEWRVKSLGEIAENASRPFDFSKHVEVIFINTGDVSEGRLLHRDSASKEGLPGQAKKRIEEGDILFSEIRPGNKRYALVNFDPFGYVVSTKFMVIRLTAPDVDPGFFYTVLTSPETLAEFQRIAESRSGTFPQITFDAVSYYPFSIPPLDEQKAIAHILGTLDDKIELNRLMNATLEAMAQALFKSWFVNFDPVIDKALAAGNPIPEPLHKRAEARKARKALGDQRKPLPASIAQHFPDRFVFSNEMCWVPEGWEIKAIGESFQLLGGHSFKSGEYIGEGLYGLVTIKNVQDGSFVEECTNRITDLPAKMKEYCKLEAGDALLSLTGNVGRVCMVSAGDYLLNQRVSKIVGRGGIPTSFAYFFFRQKALYNMMITIAKGTAQQNLSPIETSKLQQALPDTTSIIHLSATFENVYRKLLDNTSTAQSLVELRDILLPKLLSGQLRIPDAEKLIEEAL